MSTIINYGCHITGKTTINGKVYENLNGTMEITDRGIFINGKPIEDFQEVPIMKIEIHGNVDSVNSENSDVSVTGDARTINTKNGNVHVGRDVLENVETKNGNVHVNGKVMGDVTTKNGNISY